MPHIDVEITHADRVLFPADDITKGEVVDYYAEVADVMLPHLKDRPLMLQRYPRGIDEQGFVQKDFADSLPDWMGRARVAKQGGTVVHPVPNAVKPLRGWATRTASLHTSSSLAQAIWIIRTALYSTSIPPTATFPRCAQPLTLSATFSMTSA
jgi:bifunctional non-homologous end joining protein LigD